MTATVTWANVTTSLGVTSTAVSVAKPTSSAGDQVLVIVAVYDSTTVTCTDPTGGSGTIITPVRVGVATDIINIFAFYGDASVFGGTITATLSTSQYYVVIAIPITTVGAFDTSSSATGTSATQNLPAVTTGHDDELLIGIRAGFNTTISSGPSGWTQRGNFDTVTYVYDRVAATAGTVASASMTANGSENFASLVIAWQPAAAGGSSFPVPLLSSHTPFTTNYRGS